MSNTVNELKTAISWTNAQMKDVRKWMMRNTEKYSEFVAKVENDKLLATAAKVIDDGKKAVESVYNREIKAVNDFYTLDAGEITDDVKLLDGHFNLSAVDVAQLLIRYEKNGTMTQAIAKYADEHGIAHFEPRKETRVKVLTDLRDSALNRLKKISDETGIDDVFIDSWPASSFGMGRLPVDFERVLDGLTMENLNADDAGGGDNGQD